MSTYFSKKQQDFALELCCKHKLSYEVYQSEIMFYYTNDIPFMSWMLNEPNSNNVKMKFYEPCYFRNFLHWEIAAIRSKTNIVYQSKRELSEIIELQKGLFDKFSKTVVLKNKQDDLNLEFEGYSAFPHKLEKYKQAQEICEDQDF